MITLNIDTRLAVSPSLTTGKPASDSSLVQLMSQNETEPAPRSSDDPVEALKKRIKQLKKRLDQLQQQLRQANARMAAVKAVRYRSEEVRMSAIMSAKGQVVALNSAVSIALSSLFQAEKALIGSINLSI